MGAHDGRLRLIAEEAGGKMEPLKLSPAAVVSIASVGTAGSSLPPSLPKSSAGSAPSFTTISPMPAASIRLAVASMDASP
jgi:hypothetical protein